MDFMYFLWDTQLSVLFPQPFGEQTWTKNASIAKVTIHTSISDEHLPRSPQNSIGFLFGSLSLLPALNSKQVCP